MRRWGMLAVGFCISGWLMGVLVLGGMEQYRTAYPASASEPLLRSLPLEVEDTPMIAVELVAYDGPFWEDGSGEKVAGVCALVIENTGGTMICQGEVALQTRDSVLEFSFSWLPPDAKILVPERNRASAGVYMLSGCSGWCMTMYPENTGAVTVYEQGMGQLAFVNHSTQIIERVEAVFKSWDPEAQMYIGGSACTVYVDRLLPGEERPTLPWRYVSGYSKVVCVFLHSGSG